MGDAQQRPPESELLYRTRTLRTPQISTEEAARASDISPERWQQIEKGYRSGGRGRRKPVTAPAHTLARMARALEITPDQLEQDGNRADAAKMLRDDLGQDRSYQQRLAAAHLDADKRAMVERLLNDPAEPAQKLGRTLVELVETASPDQVATVMDLVRSDLAEHDRGLSSLTTIVSERFVNTAAQ